VPESELTNRIAMEQCKRCIDGMEWLSRLDIARQLLATMQEIERLQSQITKLEEEPETTRNANEAMYDAAVDAASR
jgi:hypothetical protein